MLVAVASGKGFTVTEVVAVAVQEPSVTVTVYTPLIAGVEEAIAGFCVASVNPFGPLQLYVPPPVEDRAIVAPSQYAPLLDAVGTGRGFTVTLVVAVAVQPVRVTVTVYTPLIAVVEPAIVGVALVEVNAFGPLHE